MSESGFPLLVLVSEVRAKRAKRPQSLYRFLFDDGSVLYSRCLDPRILAAGRVEMITNPQYCWKCRAAKPHLYYKHSDNIHCITCGSEMDDKLDTRPLATLLELHGKQQN